MLKFDLLILGDTGWGDELLISSIMTILVSLSAMGLGIFIAIFTSWAKISGNIILKIIANFYTTVIRGCLLYTSPRPRAATLSRMPSSA